MSPTSASAAAAAVDAVAPTAAATLLGRCSAQSEPGQEHA
jgi:hypothetical protein